MALFACMKKILLLIFISQQLLAQQDITSKQKDSFAIYNKLLTPHEMKRDLKVFRNIRDKANSGLYRYRSAEQIDSIYDWAFKQAKRPLLTTEFFKIILRLTDFEGSVHNYTEPATELMSFLNRQRAFFPYSLKYIEGKIIFDGKCSEVPVGARILSINGVRDTTLMQSFYKHFPADGYTTTEKLSASVNRSFGVRYLLEYGLQDSFAITFTAPGTARQSATILPAVHLEQRLTNLRTRHSAPVDSLIDYNVQPKYGFQMVNPSTGLLNLRIFTMATGADDPALKVYISFLDSVFNVLDKNGAQNLIMDIRSNPGGSDPTFEQPMMYLSDKPFKENTLAYIIFDELPYEKYFWGISTSVKMGEKEKEEGKKMLRDYFPKYENGRSIQNPKYNPVYYPKTPAFKGKLYLLIDENVASAASHLASLVKAYARNATIVGVETVGGYYCHNGHMALIYELPNSGIKTKFSIVHVIQDAPEKPDQPEGRGIIPDHEVWPTFEDFMQNRDTQMEFVLKLISDTAVSQQGTH
jgi:hypothetical protein